MKEFSTIGLDIAKSVFQVHGVDEAGYPNVRKIFYVIELYSLQAQ